ncbi:hypothetical protein L9F63_008298, partial [Diploptera punctata]
IEENNQVKTYLANILQELVLQDHNEASYTVLRQTFHQPGVVLQCRGNLFTGRWLFFSVIKFTSRSTYSLAGTTSVARSLCLTRGLAHVAIAIPKKVLSSLRRLCS